MGNPFYRNFDLSDAKLGKPSASAVSCTFTDSGDLVTANAHGLSNGYVVVLQTIVTTTGASVNVRYYVISATTNTFQIAATYGGSAVVLTSDGTGTFKAIIPYDIYLANKAQINTKSKTFTYAGDGIEIERTQILGYTVELDADCIPLATHMGLFGMTTQSTALPDSYTGMVYGGTLTERAGVTCELWFEGAAKRVDASTGAETDVTIRRWFPLGTVSGVTPGGQNTGDKAEVEKYVFTASKTSVDAAAGALPATIPTGGVFFATLEK